MSKFRKIMLYVLSAVLTVCASIFVAACAGDGAFADFINPTTPITPGDKEFRGEYSISVKSTGGLAISGVKVSAVLNNNVVVEGISVDGKIEFVLDPAEYTLAVDTSSIPIGYFIEEGATFKTSATSGEAQIVLSSTIISQSTPPGTRYSIGDVMYDFSFTDANTGTKSSLSEIFEGKKAVVLNFWYVDCVPCRSEFPAMQQAYSNYSDDVEIIGLNNHDKADSIKSFRKTYNLSFILAEDAANMHSFFNITAWPTTVIIDRYGAIAFWDSTGAMTNPSTWNALFATYTADDYTQTAPDDSDITYDWARPGADIVMPSSADIEQAINGTGANGKVGNYRLGESEDAQDESWPWLLGSDDEGAYLYSPNVEKNYSYSTLYVDFNLDSGDIISYEYNINTEVECDFLYVLLADLDDATNSKRITGYSGNSRGWTKENAIYTANRPIQITLCFLYLKDQLQGPSEGEEFVAIRNMRVIKAEDIEEATDFVTPAVSGDIVNGKYENYETVKLNPADGYYHLYNEETGEYGALLLADLLEATMWSSNIIGKTTFVNSENSTTTTSLYLLSFWEYSNHETASTDGSLIFTYDRTADKSISENLITAYYLQRFSDNGYIPVSENLRKVIEAFTAEYCRTNEKDYYEEQWLELCYYFIHYGSPDHEEGDVCYVNSDPTFGLTRSNAYTAIEGTPSNPVPNHVNVTKILSIDGGGGLFYEFKPTKTGIYHIYTNSTTKMVDPLIMIRTPEGTGEDSFLYELDDDMSPGKFLKNIYENVDGYVYLEANTTYYLQCRLHKLQATGKYDFFIEYTGKTEYEYLRFATTGEGLWTYNDAGFVYYIAVDVAQSSDGTYYAVNSDGTLGSKIYIDFIHPQYYDMNNHSLIDIINEGLFDFRDIGGGDYTSYMKQYYQRSISRDANDELYGLLEASSGVVNILSEYLYYRHGETLDTGYWLSFACYYEHIGA